METRNFHQQLAPSRPVGSSFIDFPKGSPPSQTLSLHLNLPTYLRVLRTKTSAGEKSCDIASGQTFLQVSSLYSYVVYEIPASNPRVP
jgi:hypothetical protein